MALPILRFFTTTGITATNLNFGTIAAGDESDEVELLLFNHKGGTGSDTAQNVKVIARDFLGNVNGEEIKEGWLLARSSGLTNPDLVGDFFDDQQPGFFILSDVGELPTGDIPNNGGRSIFFKVRVPIDQPTQAGLTFQILGGHRSNVSPLPFFFNRSFGDGVVEDEKKQIFPAVLFDKIGGWTGTALAGGGYIGDVSRQFLIDIVSGGTPGIATYRSSDDGGSTWSTTLTTGTNGTFVEVRDSNDVDLGVDISFQLTAGELAVADQWTIDTETRPFQTRAGASNTLVGLIGSGEALIANNHIVHNNPSLITLSASTRTWVYLGIDGSFVTSQSSGDHVDGRIILGYYDTDANGVIKNDELWQGVVMGMDQFDDFLPLFTRITGLTWTFFKGKFRRFHEIIRIPSDESKFFDEVTLFAGATNFVQIDPISGTIIADSTGYLQDHVPLFRVATGQTGIETWFDDRAELMASPTLRIATAFTTASVSTGLTVEFDFIGFANRALINHTVITQSMAGSGYTVSFYERDTKQIGDLEYQAGTLPNPFTDDFTWYHTDLDFTQEFHGIILNETGITQQFTIDMIADRFA